MIQVTDTVFIDEKDILFQFSRSGGPGGQNVNKVETAVELRYDLKNVNSLPPYVKSRLFKMADNKISGDGILIITASETRYQERNRELALQKLIDLVRKASFRPKPRKKTKPSRAVKEKRFQAKKKVGRKKSQRKKHFSED